MQSTSTSTSFSSQGYISADNGLGSTMENNRAEEHSTLGLLSKGEEIIIRIDPKTMLCNVMDALDAKADIVFTEIDCGIRGVRCAVKFKASSWTQEPGHTPRYCILLGEPANDVNSAENNAAAKVFEFMEENHQIKICDFSSRVVQRIDRNNTYRLLFSAMGCLDRIMFQWELTLGKCDELINDILVKQKNEVYLRSFTHIGEVYGASVNPLNSILAELNPKTEDARIKMDEVVDQRELQGHKRIDIEQRNLNRASQRQPQLGSKNVLDFVLKFLGLPKPIYTNEPGDHSIVLSSVTFFIPFMAIYKYGGNIKLQGNGKNSEEAEEQVAFKALLFIENNFKIQIADYNYLERKEFTKNEETSVQILNNIVEIANEVNHMWGRLDNVIKCQKAMLQYDPTSLFSGPSSEGQVHAFRVCAQAVEEAIKFSTAAYNICKSDFEILNKLIWTNITNKICLPC